MVLPSAENADPTPDPESMTALASLTGGIAVSATDLTALEEALPGGALRQCAQAAGIDCLASDPS